MDTVLPTSPGPSGGLHWYEWLGMGLVILVLVCFEVYERMKRGKGNE